MIEVFIFHENDIIVAVITCSRVLLKILRLASETRYVLDVV
jgi:hypothetical protein